MDDSKKYLKKVSHEANKSNKTAFDKLKTLFSSKQDPEEEKKRKRKELIDRERQRSYDEMKPKKY